MIESPRYKTPQALLDVFGPVAGEIGHVTIAWNHLQFMLQTMFWKLCGIKSDEMAFALWNSLPNDRPQRAMLAAAARVALKQNVPLAEAVSWLLKKADKLSTYRNDAIHISIQWKLEGGTVAVEANEYSQTKRAERLSDKDLAAEFGAYRDDIRALAEYAMLLTNVVESPALALPLPHKPPLPTIQRSGRKDLDQKSQKVGPAVRPHQP